MNFFTSVGLDDDGARENFRHLADRSVDPLPAGDKALGSLVLYKQTLADLKSS